MKFLRTNQFYRNEIIARGSSSVSGVNVGDDSSDTDFPDNLRLVNDEINRVILRLVKVSKQGIHTTFPRIKLHSNDNRYYLRSVF